MTAQTTHKNRIALFRVSPWSVTGLLIMLGTLSTIAHASTEMEGMWLDASESRGDFNEMDHQKYANRYCYLIEFEGDLSPWLAHLIGRKYDYTGVIGWTLCRLAQPLYRLGFKKLAGRLACGSEGKFYCFEASWFALTGQVNDKPVSGKDILREALRRGCAIRYARFGDIAC